MTQQRAFVSFFCHHGNNSSAMPNSPFLWKATSVGNSHYSVIFKKRKIITWLYLWHFHLNDSCWWMWKDPSKSHPESTPVRQYYSRLTNGLTHYMGTCYIYKFDKTSYQALSNYLHCWSLRSPSLHCAGIRSRCTAAIYCSLIPDHSWKTTIKKLFGFWLLK